MGFFPNGSQCSANVVYFLEEIGRAGTTLEAASHARWPSTHAGALFGEPNRGLF
jgi:hypothetical protein